MLMLAAALYCPQTVATEPLHDRFTMGKRTGMIFPEKCCWLPVPPSKQLRELALQQQCSAIGGPVGRYELKDGKLWLIGFETCGREHAVKEFYPEFDDPAEAVWLSGKFDTRLDYLCLNARHRAVFATDQVLVLERGAVVSVSETHHDRSECEVKGPQPSSD